MKNKYNILKFFYPSKTQIFVEENIYILLCKLINSFIFILIIIKYSIYKFNNLF